MPAVYHGGAPARHQPTRAVVWSRKNGAPSEDGAPRGRIRQLIGFQLTPMK
jgi:hypothetical protein